MENTVNITAVDGKAEATILTGRDFRVLKDYTVETFVTDSLPDFVKYCEAYDAKKHNIFYDINGVHICDRGMDDRYAKPVADCLIKPSALVLIVERILNRPLGIAEFEEFLFAVRPFMNDELKTLYSYVRNFKMVKLTEVKRTIDNRGNYEYLVKREKGGQEDVDIPETITLALPPIEGVVDEDRWEFTLDLSFDWKDTNDGVEISFKLLAPQWNTMKTEAVKFTIEAYLHQLPHKAYWGKIDVTKQDDSWKYLFNAEPSPAINATVTGYQHCV